MYWVVMVGEVRLARRAQQSGARGDRIDVYVIVNYTVAQPVRENPETSHW
ncbi:hypothetical protein PUN4_490063 [Paraburkholderia unamae]|nr:hypothetical protein PUN4_490063 [Paraburkholderia unamae]